MTRGVETRIAQGIIIPETGEGSPAGKGITNIGTWSTECLT